MKCAWISSKNGPSKRGRMVGFVCVTMPNMQTFQANLLPCLKIPRGLSEAQRGNGSWDFQFGKQLAHGENFVGSICQKAFP